MKRILIGLTALALFPLATVADGGALYQKHCGGCHGAEGQGMGTIFPPLAGNPRAEDEAYVAKVTLEGVSGPLDVGGQQYNGVMAATAGVSEADARAIAGFVKGLAGGGGSATAQPAAAEQPGTPGDAAHGRALYLGGAAFENGGAPCMACHATATLGALGGGTLAKDLTQLSARMGGASGVQAMLGNPAFPVMRATYKDKPFSDQEKRDLAAFFASVEEEDPASHGAHSAAFWLAGGGGTLGLFGVLALVWNSKRPSLAERIRAQRGE